MASFTHASNATSLITRTSLVHRQSVGATPSAALRLLAMAKKGGVITTRCSMNSSSKKESNIGTMNASLLAAVCAATMSTPAAVALVDERLSTEGTGLPFGLSNNLLGWILLGVFALIWSLYTVYTSTLDDDEDSGLSL
ncbi:hypothetical protein ACFE04_015325 [Oxalis oulophora]